MSERGYTSDEMMTIAAARMVRNGAVLFVGIGLPSAAANLARRTHPRRCSSTSRGPSARSRRCCRCRPGMVSWPKRRTLTSIHAGVAVDAVVAATGWPLKVADVLETTKVPTPEESNALRELQERTSRAQDT